MRETRPTYPNGDRLSYSHHTVCEPDCNLCKRRTEKFSSQTETASSPSHIPPPLWEERIELDSVDTRFLLIGNSSCRDPAGICAIPKAHLASGSLSIMYIPGKRSVIKFFIKFGLQKHIDYSGKKMTLSEAKCLDIEFITKIPVAVDGELKHDVQKMRIECVPGMIRLANNPVARSVPEPCP